MKNILNEELNQMKYLFGYKRGVVISEQENQDELKIKYELSKLGGDSGQEIQKYFKDTLQGNASVEPEKRFLDLINAQYSKLTPEQKNKFLAKYNQTRTTGPLAGELASMGQEVTGMSPTPSWDSINPVPQKPETAPNKTPQDSEQNTDKSKFNLPKPKSDSTELGKVNPSTKQEMENLVNQNPEKYQMAEYTGALPESQAKSKACLMAARKFGSGNFNASQHPIYDRTTKVAYCLVAKE